MNEYLIPFKFIEGEGQRAYFFFYQWWRLYMNSYMPNHVIGTAFGSEPRASQLHGHNPWLVCEEHPHMLLGKHIKGSDHTSPSPKSQVTWGQYVQFKLSKAWRLGLTNSHGVPSLKSHTWYWHLCTWQMLIGGETQELCWRLGRAKS